MAEGFDFAEGSIRAQWSGPDSQEGNVPFGFAGGAEACGDVAFGEENFGLAGVVGLGAELDLDGVGQLAVGGEAVVANVHCGDVVVLCSESEARYYAGVGDVKSEFRFLLGVDVVVEQDDIGMRGGKGKERATQSQENTETGISSSAFGGSAMTE